MYGLGKQTSKKTCNYAQQNDIHSKEVGFTLKIGKILS